MIHSAAHDADSLEDLIRRYAGPFIVRDIMVPLREVIYVAPGDWPGAEKIVAEKRFSVIPVSEDGIAFPAVFDTRHEHPSPRGITEERATTSSDFIPDSIPIVEALALFADREWYLALRDTAVVGVITYWAFNSAEFCIQLFTVFRRLEELSRDVLANDGCGLGGPEGLLLTEKVIAKLTERFKLSTKEFGGNRFVDELDFHDAHYALKKHKPWRDSLDKFSGRILSNREYDEQYGVTKLRDAVMHGRVVFPTYKSFKEGVQAIRNIVGLIKHLERYRQTQS